MLNVINLSLDLFKIETHEYDYQPMQVDLAALLSRLVRETRAVLSRKTLDCRLALDGCDLPRDKAFNIWSDPGLAYPMLSNLFRNAIEASPDNSPISIDIRSGLGTYSAKLMADVMHYTLEMETSEQENTTRVRIRIPNLPPNKGL